MQVLDLLTAAQLLWSSVQIPPATDPVLTNQDLPPLTSECQLSEKEQAFMELLINHPDQQRAQLQCNPTLVSFARERAEDMRTRGYFSHMSPDRKGPNAMLKDFGYPLPSAYAGRLSNSVESIAGGYRDPEEVMRVLLKSENHRIHLLGDQPFFQQQNEVGVAYLKDQDSDYIYYWVVIIARQSTPDDKRYVCTPEPVKCFVYSSQDKSSQID